MSSQWEQTFREIFGRDPIVMATFSRSEGCVDHVQDCLDSMELQMMGIRP